MKVGIITWWRNNYGSILQALALQQKLNQYNDLQYERLRRWTTSLTR